MKFIEAAQRLLTQFNIRTHPVPVEQIAQKLGAKVTYQPFDHRDNLYGVLFKENGKITIAVNSKDPRTRQRFTIAHECGHLALKHRGDIFVDQSIRLNRDGGSGMAIDSMEIEANGFAAELLMPRAWVLAEFNKRIAGGGVRPNSLIKDLASAFDVSDKAMEYRLENLGLGIFA
jgi:Zn-dependent peptidase ImmA (M78 family)